MSEYEHIECFTYDGEHHAAALVEARQMAAAAASAAVAPSFIQWMSSIFTTTRVPHRHHLPPAGKVLDNPGPFGSTPLIAACTKGDIALVQELLELGACPLLAAYSESECKYDGELKIPFSLVEEELLAAHSVAHVARNVAYAAKTKAEAAVVAAGDADAYAIGVVASEKAACAVASQRLRITSNGLYRLGGYATPLVAAARHGQRI